MKYFIKTTKRFFLTDWHTRRLVLMAQETCETRNVNISALKICKYYHYFRKKL